MYLQKHSYRAFTRCPYQISDNNNFTHWDSHMIQTAKNTFLRCERLFKCSLTGFTVGQTLQIWNLEGLFNFKLHNSLKSSSRVLQQEHGLCKLMELRMVHRGERINNAENLMYSMCMPYQLI